MASPLLIALPYSFANKLHMGFVAKITEISTVISKILIRLL